MSDNLQDRGSPDRKLIALGEEHEVRYWTQRFNVSEEELRRAVEQVGNSAAEVEKRLRPN
ncbi:DUF3606 domain-containing protein [Cognatilysobacter segetis]|uniref:DUF3606 domain-containing protein n=1 Tax=Cognatilysobacter segetis TaxID=2492394 RepID=UPI00105C7FF0|nr:DUF3606 domain-containing protein [Lysobacter segetis]